MTDTDPPDTRQSAQFENPILVERRRAERAEAEAMALRVQLRSMRPAADRPPLSKRIGDVVHATPRLVQWAALISAVAGLLHALMPTIRELMGLAGR